MVKDFRVSTLVLMDSWIKTYANNLLIELLEGFNPCFNGFMDKDVRKRKSQ